MCGYLLLCLIMLSLKRYDKERPRGNQGPNLFDADSEYEGKEKGKLEEVLRI